MMTDDGFEPPVFLFQVKLTDNNSTEVCYWDKNSGSCSASINSFHYDPDSKKCQPFIYSGCHGNPNRRVF